MNKSEPFFDSSSVTHGRRLALNASLNVITAAVTSGLAIVFVPIVLHRFGTDFYGILSVTWMVLANFNFLDFGFSRASARYVAKELANGKSDQAAVWTWTAMLSQSLLGVVGALIINYFSPFIVDHIHIHSNNRDLCIVALRLFAFSIPLDFANRSLTGVMQAGQRFDLVNGLSIINSLTTYAAYGIGIARANDFRAVVWVMFVFKIINLLGAYWGAVKVLPSLLSLSPLGDLTADYWPRALALVRYGWWVASAALVAPLLGQFDGWILSVLVGVEQLPFYTIPNNLLWRLSFLPNSLSAPLFPAFTAMEAKTEWGRIEAYFIRAHRYLLTVLVPFLAILYIWGGEVLRVWIGSSFADHATLPLRLLIPGFLIGLVAPISGTLLQAVGRPDILVKVYLIEVPFNAITVWFLTQHFGVAGSALSYTIRTVVETVTLWIIVYRVVPFAKRGFVRTGILPSVSSSIAFVPALWLVRNAVLWNTRDMSVTLIVLLGYCICAYWLIFDEQDRHFTSRFIASKVLLTVARLTKSEALPKGIVSGAGLRKAE